MGLTKCVTQLWAFCGQGDELSAFVTKVFVEHSRF